LRLASQSRDHLGYTGRLGKNVRAEPAVSIAAQLEHGPVPEHRFELSSAEDEPRPPGASRAARLDTPPPAHPEVAAEDEAALEAQEEVLADCLDTFQPSPVELRRELFRRCTRVGRLDLEPLADERPQAPCGPMQRVALGHER
jgi:hypothetical protein